MKDKGMTHFTKREELIGIREEYGLCWKYNI